MTIQSMVLYIHLVVALMIIVLVLLQRGKGAEAGTGFGSGASGTVFGARGSASFFSRATGVLATMFFVTSLALAYLAGQTPTAPTSILEGAGAGTSVLEDTGIAPPPATFDPEPLAVPSDLPELPELTELPELPAPTGVGEPSAEEQTQP